MKYTVFAQRLDLKKSHSLSIAKDTDATDLLVRLQRHTGLKQEAVSLTGTQETEVAGLSDSLATDIHDLLFGGTDGA